MSFALSLCNDSVVPRFFSQCLRLIAYPFISQHEIEEDKRRIFFVFERSVTLALNNVPRTVDTPHDFFGDVREYVVRKVLGHDASVKAIHLQVYRQKEAGSSNIKIEGIRQRILCSRISIAQHMIQLPSIQEENEDQCIISIDRLEANTKAARFDPGNYFDAWGELSNFPKNSNEAKAFLFLSQKIHQHELLSVDFYKELSSILLDEPNITFRSEERVTYCLSKVDLKSYIDFSSQRDCNERDFDFQHDGFGSSEFLRYAVDNGAVFGLYELRHLPVYVEQRLADHIYEFNLFMEHTACMEQQAAAGARFRAVAYLFFRIEQLQPVPGSQRVSLFLLSFLLARFGLPPALFSETFICCGENASVFSLVSFNKLQQKIMDGMRAWCRNSGNVFIPL